MDTTEKRQDAFLNAYAKTGTITSAANALGLSRKTHYAWIRNCDGYKERFDEAREELVESLEGAAVERARDGVVVEKVYDKDTGKLVKEKYRHSDLLLLALLRANKPEKYRENFVGAGTEEEDFKLTADLASQLALQINKVRAKQQAGAEVNGVNGIAHH